MMTFSKLIEQEWHKWPPFRRLLSKEDQEAFDRMFACAKQQLQLEVQLGRPWRFEVVLMAVLLEHEKRIEQLLGELHEFQAQRVDHYPSVLPTAVPQPDGEATSPEQIALDLRGE
jgi:hypothetical protein